VYSYLSHLECSRTGQRYDADAVQGVSDVGAPLLARYDLERVAATLDRAELATRGSTLWRYHEVLPVREERFVATMGEGWTPIVDLPAYGRSVGMPRLAMKDEGLIPTGTFKARGAAVGVSRAAELGVRGVAMPTNGNAGSAWAGYAARAGLPALIVMPEAAPEITRVECVAAGAELYLVDGLIGDAAAIVRDAVDRRPGWQEVSTLKEPYRLEGKKTMGYELAEQLGWRLPDVILYPTGGGVGLIGIQKALLEMRELGWVTGPLPRWVAVQASGCAPIVRAYSAGATESEPFPDAHTVAFGLTVPKALGDFLVLDALRQTDGCAVEVTDEQLLAEQRRLASSEGTFICPEGAACMAAARDLRESGWIRENEHVLVINTGTGIKYPETVAVDAPLLRVGDALPASSVDR
jgi:threonine synthase